MGLPRSEISMQAFSEGNLLLGHGTGMSSLGMQYVARLLNQPIPAFNVESGYGALLVEMGIFGPSLWFMWVGVLLWQGWKIVRNLRETVYFPLGFAIWWYAVVDLVLLMFFGMQFYQNFVNNAYLWLLTGVLYRLPHLAKMPQPIPILVTLARRAPLAACAAWKVGGVCGIAGIATTKSNDSLRPAADRMAASMKHRGPDSQGVQEFNSCLLVNARLSIIDLSERGRMPMSSPDGQVWITYNGETYNAAGLRADLAQRGQFFPEPLRIQRLSSIFIWNTENISSRSSAACSHSRFGMHAKANFFWGATDWASNHFICISPAASCCSLPNSRRFWPPAWFRVSLTLRGLAHFSSLGIFLRRGPPFAA